MMCLVQRFEMCNFKRARPHGRYIAARSPICVLWIHIFLSHIPPHQGEFFVTSRSPKSLMPTSSLPCRVLVSTMRPSLLLAFCLVSGAIAAPIEWATSADPIVEVAIGNVGKTLERLDLLMSDMRVWSQDARAATQNAKAITREIIDKLRSGRKDIARGPSINILESAKLVDWSNALTKYFKSTSQGWVRNKRAAMSSVDPLEPCSILDQLTVLSHETSKFNDAISGKMALVAQGANIMFKGPQTAEIENAIREYGG
jgi:hypothetical protein